VPPRSCKSTVVRCTAWSSDLAPRREREREEPQKAQEAQKEKFGVRHLKLIKQVPDPEFLLLCFLCFLWLLPRIRALVLWWDLRVSSQLNCGANRPIRFAKEFTSEKNEVGLAFSNDGVGLLRVGD